MIHKISIFLKRRIPKLIWKYAPFIWRGNVDASDVGLQRLFSAKESVSEAILLKWILDIVGKNQGTCVICELGSGAGRNLLYLSQNLPHIRYLGFDINQSLVEGGNNYLQENYDSNTIELRRADIETIELTGLGIDILLTSMTLIYIHPNKILRVFRHIVENVRQGVVIQEVQGANDASNQFAGYLHDYEDLFLRLGLDKEFHIDKSVIDSSAWADTSYGVYQYTLIRR